MSDLSVFPLEQRMRWFADMNRWMRPADFPMPLPDSADNDDTYHCPVWRAAWKALTDTLTHSDMSLGWWRHALDMTDAEWREWYERERRMTISESTLAALKE